MGRGNYVPPNHCAGDEGRTFKMVYVNIPAEEVPTTDHMQDFDERLVDEIWAMLPPSFRHVETWITSSVGRSDYLLAENDYAQVILGYETDYVAVCVVGKEKENGKFYTQFDRTANKIYKHLWRIGYDLRKRTSAWTSADYVPNLSQQPRLKFTPRGLEL